MQGENDSAPSSPQSGAAAHGPGQDTAACVRLLCDPATFGPGTGRVEVKETSKSWVFLTPREVYKLKKPVADHLQDLRTLAAREANCRVEVQLNRRLAADVYLGIVAITREASGTLALAGNGDVVDWLVHMRRLPAGRMLDQVILRGEAGTARTQDGLRRLADDLTAFYASAPSARLTPQDYVGLFEEEQARNRAVLTDPRFNDELAALDDVLARFDAALAAARSALEQRVRAGKVVDGHGDLRPEHVCLVDPPVVIDCLEFSPRLRMIDPFDEIAFLGLECEILGAPEIKGPLVDRMACGLADRPPDHVLGFYTAYRAFLRARQSLAHLLVPQPRDPEKWMPKAQGYIAIAREALVTR